MPDSLLFNKISGIPLSIRADCPFRFVLVLSILLFSGCLGAFIYYGSKEHPSVAGINKVEDNQFSLLLLDVETKVFNLPEKIHMLEDVTVLTEDFEVVNKSLRKLSDHLRSADKNLQETREQTECLDRIGSLLRGMPSLIQAQDKGGLFTATHELRQEVYGLGLAFYKSREVRIQRILENWAEDRENRLFVSMVVVLCVLILIIGVIKGAYSYRQYVQRAGEVEGVNTLFAAALQSTRVGVLIRDVKKEGNPVVFVNHAFEDLTGYQLSEIPNDVDFLFGWKTDSQTINDFRQALYLHENAIFDVMVYRKDGSPFWTEWHLSPILDEEGKVSYFVSLFNDMTNIRQTQEDLIQAKKAAERAAAVKTNFLAMMSHEIRTPINGIQGVLKLLNETTLTEDQGHLLDIAITSSRALHRIINDILDYAKIEAGKVKVIKEAFLVRTLVNAVESLASPMIGGKPVKLDVMLSDDLPDYFISDAGRLQQVLLNLVSNAIKFTDKGSIHIRVFSLMEQKVNGKPGMLVRFEVQDTGVGIPPTEQEKLFQEFSQIDHSTTRRFGGTGLGLAICKRLVNLLAGEIGVDSQPGKGSRFWFMLPMEIADEPDAIPELSGGDEGLQTHPGKSPDHFTILLVEDNEVNRLVAGRYLARAGFNVEEACDGVEAVDKAKKKKYDLIFMDISMPEMDGLLATCHIRDEGGHNANVPIIALTAHAMTGDRDMCLEVGMNDYLYKPIEYNQLVKTLECWLNVQIMPREKRRDKTPVSLETEKKEQSSVHQIELDTRPVFDSHQLDQMVDLLGLEVILDVIDTFLNNVSERIRGIASDDFELVRDSAHALKGSSGNCGLKRFSDLMHQLEAAAEAGREAEVDKLRLQLNTTYDQAVEALKTYRDTYIG